MKLICMIGDADALLRLQSVRNVEVGIRCQIQDQILVRWNLFRRLWNFIGLSGGEMMRKESEIKSSGRGWLRETGVGRVRQFGLLLKKYSFYFVLCGKFAIFA